MYTSDIKGLIFDLDGVLLSTDHYHYLAWRELADSLGIDFTEGDNAQLRGVSRMESLEIILRKKPSLTLSKEEKTAIATQKNERYREFLQQLTPASVSDEVRQTLLTLHQRGYLLAVGSSSKNTRFILAQTELTDYFDAIADGNDIKNSKPDPEVFLTAADRLHLSPEVCAVIEDAEAGLEAAVRAGMLPIAYAAAYDSTQAAIQLAGFSELIRFF